GPPAPGPPTRPAGWCRRPGPGSAGWPGCDRGRRRPCGAWWSARPVTAPAPAAGLPGSARAPFPGSSGVLVGADHGRVDLGVPVQLPSSIGLGAQGGLDAGPGPVGLPAREPLVDRLPGPVALGPVPPRHGATGPEQDAVGQLAA